MGRKLKELMLSRSEKQLKTNFSAKFGSHNNI